MERKLSPVTDSSQDLASDLPHLRDGLNLSDQGNADRIVREYGNKLRFVHDANAWLIWDGLRWVRDRTGKVMMAAVNAVLRAEIDNDFKKRSHDIGTPAGTHIRQIGEAEK